jgi:cardiolipin synthase
MRAAVQLSNRERHTMTDTRALADQAFSRAAGAPLIAGNSVHLLQDARENYAASSHASTRTSSLKQRRHVDEHHA